MFLLLVFNTIVHIEIRNWRIARSPDLHLYEQAFLLHTYKHFFATCKMQFADARSALRENIPFIFSISPGSLIEIGGHENLAARHRVRPDEVKQG